MVVNPPQLVFQAHAEVPRKRYGWTGSWPPPMSLMLVVGVQTGHVAVVEPDDLPEQARRALAELRNGATVVEYVYARESYSGLPPDIDDLQDADVVRAASYVHVGTTRYAQP